MKQVVYVDILLGVNLFLNYLLLVGAGAFLHIKAKRLRLLLASALGSLFSLSIFLPELPLPVSLLLKAGGSVILVLAAFSIRSKALFLRAYSCFLLVSFAFAGIMMGLWYAFSPQGMVYRNGSVYFDINILTLTFSALICYFAVSIIVRFFRRNAPDSHICDITVLVGHRQVCGKALFDSGNALREGFSDAPVIVVDAAFIKAVVPELLKPFLLEKQYDSLSVALPETGIRLVPFRSVGGSGLLPAFKPDKVTLCCAGKRYETTQLYLAVSQKAVSYGEYEALVGSAFFESNEPIAQHSQLRRESITIGGKRTR